jgi:hypothetical protein
MFKRRRARTDGQYQRTINSPRVRELGWRASTVMALSMLSAGVTAGPPQAALQQSDATSDSAELDTVFVVAQRQRELAQKVSTFVSSITLPNRSDSIARWERPVCPFVAGWSLDKGHFLFQRASQVASNAGIPLAPQDCSPNLLVVGTTEPERFLKLWWRKNPRLFDLERGVGEIKRTIRTADSVRVFYNACSTAQPAKSFALRPELDCDSGVLSGSKLAWSSVRAIYSVIVVVDLHQTQDLKIEALTDYIALVALAQVRRDPELGNAPSILRLFDETDAARPLALSLWDQAFLKSLYGTDSASVLQLSEIKTRMTGDLAR